MSGTITEQLYYKGKNFRIWIDRKPDWTYTVQTKRFISWDGRKFAHSEVRYTEETLVHLYLLLSQVITQEEIDKNNITQMDILHYKNEWI